MPARIGDLTAYLSALKIRYLGPIRDQLNTMTILASRLTNGEGMVSGSESRIPLHSGRNWGIGSRGESEALPTPQAQKIKHAIFNSRYQYGSARLTGPAISATRNDEGAFASLIDFEMTGLVKDLGQSLNRQLFRDGSGVLTAATDTASSTTVTVTSTRYIRVGQILDIAPTAGGAVTHASQEVLTVPDGTTFTVTSAIDVAANQSVYLGGTSIGTGSLLKDVWGLAAIVSTADPAGEDFGKIDRDTETFWQANSVNEGGALTLASMQTAFDQSQIGDTNGDVSLLLTNHGQKNAYANLLTTNKRYPPGGEITLDGGFTGLEFNGVPLVADRDATGTADPSQATDIYFLDMSTIFMLPEGDWDWMDKDGSQLSRRAGFDEYDATLFRYFNVGCSNCAANTVLTGITAA